MGSHEKDGIEKGFYEAYDLGDVTYLPHYRDNCYIGPGFWEDTGRGSTPPANFNTKRYSENELIEAGAKPRRVILWKRRG